MAFLIAKILFLLALAAAFGAWLAWWAMRRHYQDVTLEHSEYRQEWSQWRKAVEAHLARPAPTLDYAPVVLPLSHQLEQLHTTVRGIEIPQPTPATDLQPVMNRLQALEARLAALHIPPATDLSPLMVSIQALDDRVGAIRIPAPKETDLGPVLLGLATVAAGVKAIDIPKPAPAVDLAPLHERSRQLETAIKGIVIPQPKEVDLQPLLSRMQALEAKLEAMHIPPAADLTPVLGAVRALDDKVGAIHIPTPKETDLGPVLLGLATVAAGVKAIDIPKPAPAVDLAPLHERSRQLEAAIKGIVIPQPKEPDLTPVMARIEQLDRAVMGIEIPLPKEADLQPLLSRLQALEDKVGAIRIPTPKETDLAPVLQGLATVAAGVKAIDIPKPAPAVDLSPLQERTRDLEAAVRGLVIPQPKDVDLTPLHARLQAIEEALAHRPEPVAAPVPAPMPEARQGSRNLLHSATFGRPDDLKRIKGVAEVLEKMMHDIGVYYFWQIAEWTPADIVHVDSLLTAFKGRISRDDWVPQARAFAAQPEAARKP